MSKCYFDSNTMYLLEARSCDISNLWCGQQGRDVDCSAASIEYRHFLYPPIGARGSQGLARGLECVACACIPGARKLRVWTVRRSRNTCGFRRRAWQPLVTDGLRFNVRPAYLPSCVPTYETSPRWRTYAAHHRSAHTCTASRPAG
jgi:hypothetical protein